MSAIKRLKGKDGGGAYFLILLLPYCYQASIASGLSRNFSR